ncbi:hypothetical protein HCZ21_07115 [Limosilactobacillus fermentum]|uniref:hypothetical protein n=1 Tax=Limosilactobacillus fermentum TaxID=1613 RepID=UPI0021A83570|nr:hypothetical protein [Limosilactobacillus fermentum]MCT2875772.1 hypothetical protein [Limosilactobacillus fermentum]
MKYEQILAILDKWIANMEDEFEVLWLSGRMEVLKKSIDERQSKLFKTWIKIPFTDKYFVDDIGMLPGHGWIPTAVAKDTKEVTEYNRLLKEAQALIPDMIKTREAIMPEADQALKAIANLPKEEYDRRLGDRLVKLTSYMNSADEQFKAIQGITNQPKKRSSWWKVGAKQ